jgi:tRNA(fMet)-specific endonuclease VapC
MQYLPDTNICIFFMRGRLDFDEKIREENLENFFISEITVFELRFGTENSDSPEKSQ